MDRYKKEFMSGVDVSKSELNNLKEAFKKEKFRELFKEYVDDVTSAASQAQYEKELIQLERERGVESTLLRPSPGYVLKTSVEGDCQAYINICYNDKVPAPSSERLVQNDQIGSNWSIPHIFTKGRIEINKKGVEILVYDVLFHPLALDLAHRRPEFKTLVNDTAMKAVEDGDKVKLDRRNARVVKSTFVGGKHPSILRKKAAASSGNKNQPAFDMPGYPYPDLEADPAPVVKELSQESEVEPDDMYSNPVYTLTERKGLDLSEFRLARDAKIMAAIPEELVVTIRLPLLRSAADAKLEIGDKSLSLKSEEPAKYKLRVKLPYLVDEDGGSARFDKGAKVLTVTLPVVRKRYEPTPLDWGREDSGIDSDVAHNRSSSEEELSSSHVLVEDESSSAKNERLSEEVVEAFLDSSKSYSLPPLTVTLREDRCFIILHVKSVDPSTVNHQFWGLDGVWLKFSSIPGSGKFPSHHAICLQMPSGLIVDRRSLRVEVWDNNLICSMRVNGSGSWDKPVVDKCSVGLDPSALVETKVAREPEEVSRNKEEDSDDDEFLSPITRYGSVEKDFLDDFSESLSFNQDVQETSREGDDVFEDCLVSPVPKEEPLPLVSIRNDVVTTTIGKSSKTANDHQILSERHHPTSLCQPQKNDRAARCNKSAKTRTLSESSIPLPANSKRSILKSSRSLSECHSDELTSAAEWSSSLDSNESPEDSSGVKKTVRFNDVVSKKIFRANSSILGQKKKNEKKSRNRKKAAVRRASESEADTEGDDGLSASEVSEVSDVTDVSAESSDDNSAPMTPSVESNKHHRRRGSKNRRKNASTAKQNYLLNPEP